jgi:hypothetical protein
MDIFCEINWVWCTTSTCLCFELLSVQTCETYIQNLYLYTHSLTLTNPITNPLNTPESQQTRMSRRNMNAQVTRVTSVAYSNSYKFDQ